MLLFKQVETLQKYLQKKRNQGLQIGYAYDLTTSNYSNYNSGTHEVMLRYEIFKEGPLKSPRFF